MITILLDNGHGCDTPGKRSPVWPDGRQLLEWEFNRLPSPGSRRYRHRPVRAVPTCQPVGPPRRLPAGLGPRQRRRRERRRGIQLPGCRQEPAVCPPLRRGVAPRLPRPAFQRVQGGQLRHLAREPLPRPAHRKPIHGQRARLPDTALARGARPDSPLACRIDTTHSENLIISLYNLCLNLIF